MSLHDKMANQAYLSGRRPAEFHNAAERHAKSTFFFAAIAGIVWYFWSWAWALIPGALALLKIAQSVSSTMIETRLEKIEANLQGPD